MPCSTYFYQVEFDDLSQLAFFTDCYSAVTSSEQKAAPTHSKNSLLREEFSMLKIDRSSSSLQSLSSKTLAEGKILERYDLQKMIVNNPESFFVEMKERLVLVGQEIKASEYVNDSIDLLAIDENGVAVVIELKRAEFKLQLFQAMSYAAMISAWSADDFFDTRSAFAKETIDESRLSIVDNLASKELKEINATQRIILIAEKFDYALLRTAEWLTERYGLAIRCYRIEYLVDGVSEFISCSLVYPPLEVVDQASRVRRNKSVSQTTSSITWEEVLTTIQNEAAKEFFKKETSIGERRSRDIAYRVAGTRRFWVGARKKNAYVWQRGRFDGDLDYWRTNLSNPAKVEPVESETCLRFYLETEPDFDFFEQAIGGYLQKQDFQEVAETGGSPETLE